MKLVKRIPFLIALATSLTLIIIGIVNSQYADVLKKAVKICMECVGIG